MHVLGRLTILSAVIVGGGFWLAQQSKPDAADEVAEQAVVPPPPQAKPLSDADRERLCRAGIGNLMGRDPSGIRVIRNESGVVTVRYRRSDGTDWVNQCRFGEGVIQWRGVVEGSPQRWRTREHLEYAIADNGEITIAQLMDGEVIDVAKYDLR